MNRDKMIKALISYTKSGRLPLIVALSPFFIGRGEKGYGIFRERINLSIQRKMRRKYFHKVVSSNYNSRLLWNDKSKKCPIWFMWLQGMDSAPDLVVANYRLLHIEFGDRVHLITDDNILSYVELPAFILRKRQEGKISNAHFSDIVRIQLISTYGGAWIDSTLVISDPQFLSKLRGFVVPQTFKPGRTALVLPVSNWFIYAESKGMQFPSRVRDLLFEYWKLSNRAIDYYIFHHLMMIVSEEMDSYLDTVYPVDNTMPHLLMLEMRNSALSKEKIVERIHQSQFLKFTNKHENKIEIENYRKLVAVLNYYLDSIEK